MTLTDTEARKILELILDRLREVDAQDVLAGIDETRRIGIEEQLSESTRPELKQVAQIRRRPPSDREMLHIAIDTVNQRLRVLPRIADSIATRLGSKDIRWRVDTEFSSVDRFPLANLGDLLPPGVEEISDTTRKIDKLLGSPEIEV